MRPSSAALTAARLPEKLSLVSLVPVPVARVMPLRVARVTVPVPTEIESVMDVALGSESVIVIGLPLLLEKMILLSVVSLSVAGAFTARTLDPGPWLVKGEAVSVFGEVELWVVFALEI